MSGHDQDDVFLVSGRYVQYLPPVFTGTSGTPQRNNEFLGNNCRLVFLFLFTFVSFDFLINVFAEINGDTAARHNKADRLTQPGGEPIKFVQLLFGKNLYPL